MLELVEEVPVPGVVGDDRIRNGLLWVHSLRDGARSENEFVVILARAVR